jgi:hypothetical protein
MYVPRISDTFTFLLLYMVTTQLHRSPDLQGFHYSMINSAKFMDWLGDQAEQYEGTMYKDENVPKDSDCTTILPKNRTGAVLCAVGCDLTAQHLKIRLL